MPLPSLKVGLTGGIGSGKSTVAAIFSAHDIPVIDTDEISRNLTKGINTKVLKEIKAKFGTTIFEPDGTLNRSKLREIVFSSSLEKEKLEAIMHPLIREEALRQCEALKNTAPLIILDLPLLAENSDWLPLLNKVLVIDCEEEIQIQRVINRSGWTSAQIKAVIAAQASRENRLQIATNVINNSTLSLEELSHQVSDLIQKWQQV